MYMYSAAPVVVNDLQISPLRPFYSSPPSMMKSRSYERLKLSPRSRSPRTNSQRQMAQMQRKLARSRSSGYLSKTPESVRKYQRATSAELSDLLVPRRSVQKPVDETFEYSNPLFGHKRERRRTPSEKTFRNYEGSFASAASNRLNSSLRMYAHHRGPEKPFMKIMGRLVYRNMSSDRKNMGSLYYVDSGGSRVYRNSWSKEFNRAYDAALKKRR